MMVGEDTSLAKGTFESTSNLARQMELLPKPQRHRLHKGAQTARCVREVGLQQALEFQPGLVVKADVVQVIGLDSHLAQAVLDGVDGKPVIVLLACETLLLGRGRNLPVDQQRRR
jgi:hypothetical protein